MSDFPVVPDPAELPVSLEDKTLDIQHDTDPAPDQPGSHRIPNLGHALTFFSLALLSLQFVPLRLFSALHLHPEAIGSYPRLALIGEVLSWVAALAAAAWLFPRQWHRPFLLGIQWNSLAARRWWLRIVPAAIALSAAIQVADRFVKSPTDDIIGKIVATQSGAWMLTVFGITIIPLMEEVAFRGFLMPALATMYDWLALDRTPQGLRRWDESTTHTVPALVFGAVFSSVPFALMHVGQLHGAWGAVGLLYLVSLALSYVRARTHSVAASTLMHAAYNATAFAYLMFQTGFYRHLDKL